MIKSEVLKRFVYENDSRPHLIKPFNFNGYTYATNGISAIRFPALKEFIKNETTNMEKVWPNINEYYNGFRVFPSINIMTESFFNSGGHTIINIYGQCFKLTELRKFRGLINLRISVSEGIRPCYITFNKDGEGIIMPVV